MEKQEFRTVRYFHQFFNHWAVRLEKRVKYRFLWWERETWEMVCNMAFDDIEPSGWGDFNIIERLTDENLIPR